MAEHPKNQSEHSKPHDLVKPGSTMDPKGHAGQPAPPPVQGQVGNQQQGQSGQISNYGQNQPGETDAERMRREDPQFIEKTRPEDPSGRPGQLTRDNVNPHIPSAKRDPKVINPGGIVDPASLGMEQGGKEPNYPPQEGREGETPELPEGVVSPRSGSINEPPGSNVYGKTASEGGGGTPPDVDEPIKITSLEPDSAPVTDPAGGQDQPPVTLTVTGENFDGSCKIVFDDEELETQFVSDTQLTAQVPMSDEPGEVDVEVEKGEESSEVLTFEFTAPEVSRSEKKKEPTRKPKKPTPSAKRDKSNKKKKR